MDAKQIMSADINDIVFEGRNKAYGAYDLRKKYNKNLNLALAICTAVLLLAFLSPYISEKFFSGPAVVEEAPRESGPIELTEAPPLDETLPPPPPEIEMPKLEIVQNIPPQVVEEEVVSKVRDVQDQLEAPNLGQQNQEGLKTANFDMPVTPPPAVQETKKETVQEKIEEFADEEPYFPDYNAYMSKNLNYPPAAADAGLQGNVILKFVVEKDGSISNIGVEKGLGMGCTEEAIRMLRSMPKWRPGKTDGHPVRVAYQITVKFTLK